MKTSKTGLNSVGILLLGAILCACHGPEYNAAMLAHTTIGNEIDDSVLTSMVRTALLADQYVKSLDVKVEAYKGEVMLSGFASTQAEVERSVLVAQSVAGVKRVNNQLSLKSGVQSIGNKVDDSVITASIKSAMLADELMKSGEVSVVTHKGEVQLSGYVDNSLQLTRAWEVATTVEGVGSVVNHLELKR